MFLHASLLAGFAFVALPVLIHLINLMRHRRVRWAAMSFLLASQKTSRTRVLFKQLLLLLMRMAAIALIVLVVAKPVVHSQWGRWFGNVKTHHVVLLDDSYSMSDRWADTSAFQQAKAVVGQIAEDAARQVNPQELTLLRFSRTARADRATQPDFAREPVDASLVETLRERLNRMTPSQTAAGPAKAMEAVSQLLGEPADERRVVYVVTDVRARQWNEPGELRQRLVDLNEAGATVVMVACAREQHANLAVTSIEPVSEIRAAGVPLRVEVAVRNWGPTDAANVAVAIEEDGHARPGLAFARIPAGQTAKERFLLQFSTAGEHRVSTRLESDAVAADNARYRVVKIPPDVPVLLIDGDPSGRNAKFLSAALAPRGAVRSGIRVRGESPRFLSMNPLSDYRTIYLLNVERLDESARGALENYIASGGSAAVFLGDRTGVKTVNDEWHRAGRGFFPAPLAGPTDLAVDRLQPAPDLDPSDHPMFRAFAGERNSALQTVSVRRYFALAKGWKPSADSATQIVCRLRNGEPLVLESRFGEGKVVAVLTTAAPDWNNWAQDNPTYLAAMLSLQSHLGDRRAGDASVAVGSPLRVEIDPAQYQPTVRFSRTQRNAAPIASVDAAAEEDGRWAASTMATDSAGFLEAQLTKTDGQTEVRQYAINVDPSEGDLAFLNAAQLENRLAGVPYTFMPAASFQAASPEAAGAGLSQTLLLILAALLVCEQALAWSASYHPLNGASARGGAA